MIKRLDQSGQNCYKKIDNKPMFGAEEHVFRIVRKRNEKYFENAVGFSK